MNVVQLIENKRDGGELSTVDIESTISEFEKGELPTYQMSALAMAIYFQGLNFRETVDFTRSMRDSGQVMRWEGNQPKVDKHSTGGIGDKISIPLAPALAACGLDVPMVSGRSLGPTGGTLDKLESIKQFRCDLSMAEFQNVVDDVGCVISGASDDIAPADKKLYALRDVTGTVPSIGLITASILSKKLAEGLDALVLDVKWGSGAFMKTFEEAKQLAEMLVRVGQHLGTETTALITNMNQPLGEMIGNAVEIYESIDILNGGGPKDVQTLVCELGAHLLVNTSTASSFDEGCQKIKDTLSDGSALQKFKDMVAAQSGNISDIAPQAPAHVLTSQHQGFVSEIDCEQLGIAVIELGGGRRKLGDKIDFSVGIKVFKKAGDAVAIEEPLAEIYSHTPPEPQLHERLCRAFSISESPTPQQQLIRETITIDSLKLDG